MIRRFRPPPPSTGSFPCSLDTSRRKATPAKFVIHSVSDGGWEVREEADRHIVRQVHYSDWHRVERARSLFAMRILSLEEAGWVDVAPEGSSAPPSEETAAKARAARGTHSTNR